MDISPSGVWIDSPEATSSFSQASAPARMSGGPVVIAGDLIGALSPHLSVFSSTAMFVFSALCWHLNPFSPPSSGQFLWVNGSSFGGPWVLSPWLRGEQGPCGLDMAVLLHPKQSGKYTVWLVERDKPPLALFSTDTLPRITG